MPSFINNAVTDMVKTHALDPSSQTLIGLVGNGSFIKVPNGV